MEETLIYSQQINSVIKDVFFLFVFFTENELFHISGISKNRGFSSFPELLWLVIKNKYFQGENVVQLLSIKRSCWVGSGCLVALEGRISVARLMIKRTEISADDLIDATNDFNKDNIYYFLLRGCSPAL